MATAQMMKSTTRLQPAVAPKRLLSVQAPRSVFARRAAQPYLPLATPHAATIPSPNAPQEEARKQARTVGALILWRSQRSSRQANALAKGAQTHTRSSGGRTALVVGSNTCLPGTVKAPKLGPPAPQDCPGGPCPLCGSLPLSWLRARPYPVLVCCLVLQVYDFPEWRKHRSPNRLIERLLTIHQ